MPKELTEYRVKPAENYGTERNVKIALHLDTFGLIPKDLSRLHFEYDNETVVVYNPQRLAFDVHKIISAIQTIHGRANSIYGVEKNVSKK